MAGTGSGKVRVLLVDGGRMIREGLRAMLSRQPDLDVAGECDAATGISEPISEPATDVVVVTILSPGASSIESIHQVRRERPDSKVLALSAFSSRFLLNEVLRAGAQGYVTMERGFDELLEAIRAVVSGLVYVCSTVGRGVLPDLAKDRPGDHSDPETALTDRERVILRLLGDGKTSKEIAQIEGLSSKTIDASRRHLMAKLRVNSVAGLVKYAIMMELTSAAP